MYLGAQEQSRSQVPGSTKSVPHSRAYGAKLYEGSRKVAVFRRGIFNRVQFVHSSVGAKAATYYTIEKTSQLRHSTHY